MYTVSYQKDKTAFPVMTVKACNTVHKFDFILS